MTAPSATLLSRWPLALAILLSAACASLPPRAALAPQHAFDAPLQTTLGAAAQALATAHPARSAFVVEDTGRDAFAHRAALIEAAERSIDAQYYIWNSDETGGYLARRLLAAADRGVRVRLLLDDINVAGRDATIAALDRHPNIEIRIYNPSGRRGGPGKALAFLGDFRRLNRRMHNKTFVVDAAYGIAGGRNIGDEYFDHHAEKNFRDRDLLAAGPVVRDMSRAFDAYWNSPWSYPIAQLAGAPAAGADDRALYEKALAGKDAFDAALARDPAAGRDVIARAVTAAVWAPAEFVFDPPPSRMDAAAEEPKHTAQALGRLVQGARSEILIESAYFILGPRQLERWHQLTASGVRTRALTNSLASNDLVTNHSGYARHRKNMLDAGMELHELRPDAAACAQWIGNERCPGETVGLHAKSVVFDREVVYVGSFNVNLRSIYLNAETVMIIHSPELAQRIARDIETGMEPRNSWRVTRAPDGSLRWDADDGETWRHEPRVGRLTRIKSRLLSLLPVEKYL